MILGILLLSIILLPINQYYVTPCHPFAGQLIQTVSLSLFAASIFYSITTLYPKYNEKKKMKEFLIERYCATKINIFNLVLSSVHKIEERKVIEKCIRDYTMARKVITNDDLIKVSNNINRWLLERINFELNTLKTLLILALSHDYLRKKSELYKRSIFLINWIDQFALTHVHSLENDQHDLSKMFLTEMEEYLLGYSAAYGEKKYDTFIKILEKA